MTEDGVTSSEEDLIARLQRIVGRRHVLTKPDRSSPYRKGYREGEGPALAVVRPGSLLEQWRVLCACIEAGVIVIPQAANTGLTGGSTPCGDYDRPVVVVSTLRLNQIHAIDDGKQVVCLPGATLAQLERRLRPWGREPHSVIGSTCFGATVVGGVSNNSGGALVQRGPAFTELSLFAQVGRTGEVTLINHLGIRLDGDPEAMLQRVQRGEFQEDELEPLNGARASDPDYGAHVRDIAAPTPARFNADPRRLHEASGCAGRIMVFAVRLDTFPALAPRAVVYAGAHFPDQFARVRRRLLTELPELPIAAEYIHRDAFRMAERYGKDLYLAARWLGAERLPTLNAAKRWFDQTAGAIGARRHASDSLLQWFMCRLPPHLPRRLRALADRFEHHLLLDLTPDLLPPALEVLRQELGEAGFFECSRREASAALHHRFAVAGAAIRFRAVRSEEVGEIVALDVALPRNATRWADEIPPSLNRLIRHRLYYGHFLCHVFHQDYILCPEVDAADFKRQMLAVLEARGAEYPAEHNVGHGYRAKRALAAFYRRLDPANQMNPGIGQTSRREGWKT